jgi:secondary thiamine-phosphate synthase enzyme
MADSPDARSPLTQAQGILRIETRHRGFHDVTADIVRWLAGVGAGDGLLTVFVRHTSASIVIQENADPDVQHDLLSALEVLAPEDRSYRHASEGADDMPAHIKSMLTATSISIPVARGRPLFGTWQALYLVEHRTRPHRRAVVLHYVGQTTDLG